MPKIMTDQMYEGQRVAHFAIIEQAGYEGEKDIGGRFATQRAARQHIDRHYDADEIEDMHVDVAAVLEDGSRTYDLC